MGTYSRLPTAFASEGTSPPPLSSGIGGVVNNNSNGNGSGTHSAGAGSGIFGSVGSASPSDGGPLSSPSGGAARLAAVSSASVESSPASHSGHPAAVQPLSLGGSMPGNLSAYQSAFTDPADISTRNAANLNAAVGGKGRSSSAGATAESHKRSITMLQMVCLGYLGVSAGPFGLEVAVGAAGAGFTLLGVLIVPLIWGLPQALMTAELSTMLDTNGGFVVWVRRGLGNAAGWMAAYNVLASNICDMPLYLGLVAQYASAFAASALGWNLSPLVMFLLKATAGIAVTLINIRGVRSVSFISVASTFLVVTPFLLEPLVALKYISPDSCAWLATVPRKDWGLFLSTVLWNFQGWDALGSVAGEVQSGRATYVVGLSIAVVLMTVTFIFPVGVGVCIDPNMADWSDGLFETIAQRIATWLGAWVLIAAVVANLGGYNVVMCANSRSLWAMGRRHMAPSILGYSSPTYDTPVVSILVYIVANLILVNFGFSTLVVLDTFFKNIGLALEAISFVRLRYIEPNTPRPFVVPYGLLGAYAVAVPMLAVVAFTAYSANWRAQVICCGANVVFLLAYFARQRWCSNTASDEMDAVLIDASPLIGTTNDVVTASGQVKYRKLGTTEDEEFPDFNNE